MRTDTMQPAKSSGIFKIGGDLPLVRLGYGAMRITGPGVWGPPKDPDGAIRVLRRAVDLWKRDRAGPNEVRLIVAEPAFPPSLRARPDFQKLVKGG